MNKKAHSERDICTKFISPAIEKAGWDNMSQIREEASFTKGSVIVREEIVSRGKGKRADYKLYFKPNIPIAIVDARDKAPPLGALGGGLEAHAAFSPRSAKRL
jgi:type I restriction enzyme R subunit